MARPTPKQDLLRYIATQFGIYTENFLNKLIITKYGFAKYAVETRKAETGKCSSKQVHIIEIQKHKSLLITGKKSKY
jgi:hypothetical protein